MKNSSKLLCCLLALALALILPFAVPAGNIPDDAKALLLEETWQEDENEGEDSALLTLLFPAARAEETFEPLPMDFSPGRKPDKALFTPNGYEDASIKLKLETVEKNGVVYRVAYVTVSHPSQLRTATAGKPQSSKVAMISAMAEKNNAVIAINADYMANNPTKTSFEYRMGEKVRAKQNPSKDLLITDENGDFHIFTGKNKKKDVQAFEKEGHRIINAFTFGPGLVINNELRQIPDKYGYNPKGREPRMAIGQMGELSYVMVLAEGRSENSQGVTQQELAEFMFDLGCVQAFNLDGGNSATMVYDGGYYQEKTVDNERAQSDMIYFATLVPAK